MKVGPCSECGVAVIHCDNDVRLDHPAVEYDDVKAPWTIIFGRLASVGEASPDGKGHALHEHQSAESVMA